MRNKLCSLKSARFINTAQLFFEYPSVHKQSAKQTITENADVNLDSTPETLIQRALTSNENRALLIHLCRRSIMIQRCQLPSGFTAKRSVFIKRKQNQECRREKWGKKPFQKNLNDVAKP